MMNYTILAKYMNNDCIVLTGLLDEATAIVLCIDCCGEFAQLTYPAMIDHGESGDDKTYIARAVLIPEHYEVGQDRSAAMTDVKYILGYDDSVEGSDIDDLEEQLKKAYPGLKTTACSIWFNAFMSQLTSQKMRQERILGECFNDWLQAAAKNIQHGVSYDVVLEDFYNARTQLVITKTYPLDNGCWAADAVDISDAAYQYSLTCSADDKEQVIVHCSTTGFEATCISGCRNGLHILTPDYYADDANN